MINNTFEIHNNITISPSNTNFHLHSHDSYEIFLFLEGDTQYIVEGDSYTLKPYDIIIIRKHEMHRAYHNSPKKYERYVLNVFPDFFKKYNCEEYEEEFLNTGKGNKINAEIVLSSGLYDAFSRLKRYTDNLKDTTSPIAISIMTEILYLINSNRSFMRADLVNRHLSTIIDYINNNYTESINLDELSVRFYISKYHLCHSFRKAIGLTVHQYITQKRISYIKELVKKGKRISEASALAGYNSYSSFYRAYRQEYGRSPKDDIK